MRTGTPFRADERTTPIGFLRWSMSSAVRARPSRMTNVTCQLSVSLDGYLAGPAQSMEHPLGVGGEALHEWAFPTAGWRAPHGLAGGTDDVDSQVAAEALSGVGAFVMGRNMFGPARDGAAQGWRGWWGDAPPFHAPVFVLTHHAREPIAMAGGTTFHFVTDGVEAAVERAREVAGDGAVAIAGGA